MPRIVEHRSALPNGPVVEVHVQYDPECEFPVHARVEISLHRAHLEPKPFPEILPSPTRSSGARIAETRRCHPSSMMTPAATSRRTTAPSETWAHNSQPERTAAALA